MPFKLLFLFCMVLCIIALFDVLFSMRKNSLLKTCLLLIIASLFVMNYLSYAGSLNRFEMLIIRCGKIVYASSIMLIVIQHVTPKIPKWIIGFITFSVIFLVGLRVVYFGRIAIDAQSPLASQIFAVGPELNSPVPLARYSVYAVASIATLLTFYFYRKFFMMKSMDDNSDKLVSRWIMSSVTPFFLLIIFGVLGSLGLYEQSVSAYLFSCFSLIAIFAILFRPRVLNVRW
jgi:hypothetical protein